MKPKPARASESPNDAYKHAITRSIDSKIKRLEARARPRAGENGDTAAARAKWLQLKAELTELEVRRRRNELVEVREIELVLSNVMANLRQKMSGFPAHILPEIRRLVVLTPEQLPALHATLKRFTHSWLRSFHGWPPSPRRTRTCAISSAKTTNRRRSNPRGKFVKKKVKGTMKSNQNAESLLKKLSGCKDIVNDWEDWSAAGFSWWQPVFDLLDPNDEVVKTRFAHIQVRYALRKRLRGPSE